MAKVFYIGNFSFPYGNASGARVIGNSYLFRKLGYEVSFIGLDRKLDSFNDLKDTKFTYDNFTCYNFPTPKGFSDWINFNSVFEKLINLLEENQVEIVVLYGSLSLSLINEKIRKWCVKHKVKFYVDCVDMLPVKSGNILFKIVKSFDEYYQKKVVNHRAEGLIAISDFISDYYKKSVPKTVVLPPLSSSERYENKIESNFTENIVNLTYVGNPFPTDGRKVERNSFKDRLDLVIEVLSELDNNKFIFRIYGLTKQEYLNTLPEHRSLLKKLKDNVIFGGPIDNKLAIVEIRKSDFTILFRDINLMSTAGFPTKFTESISCGTPVITNNTSDLKNYVINGKNGFIFESIEKEYLVMEMNKILGLNREDIISMKDFTFSNNPFYFANFEQKLKSFLQDR